MPEKFYDLASRVDHVLSAFLPGRIDKLNVSEYFDLSIKFPTDLNEATSVTINNISTSIPLSYELNYGNIDQMSVDYGLTSICSLYKNNLNSFAQKPVQLNDSLKTGNTHNSGILFVAECSDKPRLAIFVEYKNNSNDFSQVKVYTGGHFFTMQPENGAVITFNGELHNIRDSTFEYPPFQSDFK